MTDWNTLNKPQQNYVLRLLILDEIGLILDPTTDRPLAELVSDGMDRDDILARGIKVEELEAYLLALEDYERARDILEEDTAFKFYVEKLQSETPDAARTQIHKAARNLVADPAMRARAVAETKLFETFGEPQ